MKIKMYTKAICLPFEGAPYEKTTCVVYDSIDDINMIGVEDTLLVKDAEVSYRFVDTDGDTLLRKPVVYPYLAQDPILFAKKMLSDKWNDTVGKYSNMITRSVFRKLTLSDLNHEWLQRDYDGISSAEENAFKWMYGPKEKYWRTQREFFNFVAGHNNVEKIALFTAAKAVFDAMRLAGEDEETIRKYKINVVIPAMKRHH